MAIRFFILSSHYRQNTDFSDEALKGAAKGYERLLSTVSLVRQKLSVADDDKTVDAAFLDTIEQHKARFIEAINNDFNTPRALATIFDFNKAVNTLINADQPVSRGTLQAIDDTYRSLGGDILGLIPDEISGQGTTASPSLDQDLIRILVDLRAAARKNKDYATSDAIRDQLAEIGVILEDRPDGTVWKMARN